MLTLYSLFKCEESISYEKLKQLYFDLLRRYHPDRSGSEDCETFLALNRAWEILGDSSSRLNYNIWLREQRIRATKELIGKEIWISREQLADLEEEQQCRCGGIYEELGPEIFARIIDYALVLLLGDSGVGKSTLINTLCSLHNIRPQSTLGCSVQILAHQYLAGTPNESTELVELWDIGGSNAHREASSRVFMDSPNGIIFVHDLSNSRSEQNLALWIDLLQKQRRNAILNSSHMAASSPDPMATFTPLERSYASRGASFIALDLERFAADVPQLVVGTCLDQCLPKRVKEHASGPLLRQHISLDARRQIQPGSTNRLVFSNFFDAVIRHSADNLNIINASSSPSLSATNPRYRNKIT